MANPNILHQLKELLLKAPENINIIRENLDKKREHEKPYWDLFYGNGKSREQSYMFGDDSLISQDTGRPAPSTPVYYVEHMGIVPRGPAPVYKYDSDMKEWAPNIPRV